jgi:hypothetical protein
MDKTRKTLDGCDCDFEVHLIEQNDCEDVPADCENTHTSPEDKYRQEIRQTVERSLERHRGASLDETLVELYLVSVPEHLLGLARSFCKCMKRVPNKKEDSAWRSAWQLQYELGLTGEEIERTYTEMMYAGLSVKSPASVTGMADSARRRDELMREKEVAESCVKRALRLPANEDGKSMCGVWYTRQQIELLDDQAWQQLQSKNATYDMMKHISKGEMEQDQLNLL